MFKKSTNKTVRYHALAILLVLACALPSYAGVIFEDNFDSQADWNVSGAYDTAECSVGNCDANTYPANWSFYRLMPGTGGLSPIGTIRRPPNNAPDHSTGTGKAYVAYNQSVPNINWPGDAIIGKYFGASANYTELYIRFWFRTQVGWSQVSGMSNKIFRLSHWRAGDNIFQWADQNSPFYISSIGATGTTAAHISSYRCDAAPYAPRSSDYYCESSEIPDGGSFVGNYQKSDIYFNWSNGGAPSTNFADGQWHRFDYHLKMNDIGRANGIMEWSVDGVSQEARSNVMWKESSSSSSIGWNSFAIGGNSDNTFGGSSIAEQWYAYDDVAVSTTPIPADYVIGGGSAADTTPPTVSLSSPASNATVSGTVSVTANASDNVGVSKVEYYVNGALKSTDTSAPYVYSWDTSAVAAGTYALLVKAYDAAGNVGQSGTVSVSVVKDTAIPTVSLTSPANNATVSGTVAITASAADNIGVSKVEYYKNNVLLAAGNVAPYSSNWNTASESNGTHTITAKAYDATGNIGQSSAVTVTVNNTVNNPVPDTTAPAASVTSPAANTTVSGTVNIAASASDNVGVSKVEFYVNGTLKATDTATPYSYSWNTTSVTNGSNSLTVKAYDAAGNMKQSAAVAVTVNNSVSDSITPTVSITAPAPNATVSGTINISATANDNVGVTKVELYVNGVLNSINTTDNPYYYSWNTTGLANGSYTLTTKAYDAAGNVGQSSAVTVTVNNAVINPVSDTTAPVTSVTSPAANATVRRTVYIKASATDNVGVKKVEYYINGVLKATDTAAPYSYSWNSKTVANGSYSITTKAYDAAGNAGQSAAVKVTVRNW